MIRFRVASRQVEGWSLKENWAAISGEIADEQLVFPVLVGAAGLLLLGAAGASACRWSAGRLASLGLLLVYSPLQFKHAVILLPPAGAADRRRGRRGLAALGGRARTGARLPWHRLAVALLLGVVVRWSAAAASWTWTGA